MAGLKIENETVYVIYRNGEPYQTSGRKLVYTTLGAANGIITTDAKRMAESRYLEKRRDGGYVLPDWYKVPRDKRKILIDDVRKEFVVIPYGPKEGIVL